MSADFTIPDGYYPPFARVTDQDHTAWIIISTTIGLALTLLFGGIRIFIRKQVHPPFGHDDSFCAIATLYAVVQAILTLLACNVGLGRARHLTSDIVLVTTQKLYYAATLLFVISLGLSKASVALFLLRIAPFNPQRRATQYIFGLIIIWTIVLFFCMALQCNLAQPWVIVDLSCSKTLLRWELLESLGCAFEVAFFGICLWLIWNIGAIRRSHKPAVVIMFAFRLPVITFVTLRLRSYPASDEDPMLDMAEFNTWSQAELTYSLISSTILIMRPFISNLVTNYGGHGSAVKDRKPSVPNLDAYQLQLLQPTNSSTGTPPRKDS
ncbi:hypothetical protein Slin14017_G111310 [Septoria linicola]|nr:hypothetical protein Slin14017_G111310 [Septoria linicola]